MRILIKGMEMPTSCDNCWALDDYGDYPRCRITEEQRGYNFPIRQKRMDNCPLIELPPHGDLIDRNDLRYSDFDLASIALDKGNPYKNLARDILARIESAPTILEAEEGE